MNFIILTGMAIIVITTITRTSAGEDVEKLESSYIPDGNKDCVVAGQNSFVAPQKESPALGRVAQLVGASSCTLTVCRFDSWSGTYLGCGLASQSGSLQEATNRCFSHTNVSLTPFLSLKAMKKCPWVKINNNKKNCHVVVP